MTTYRFIDAEKANWTVRMLCRVLGVSRAAYYAWARGGESARDQRNARDAALVVHIKAIHRRSRRTYGSPRVHAELRAEGHRVGRKRVARLMRAHGLDGTPRRRFRGTTTQSDHDKQVAENLLKRDFKATAPNRVWVGDITYLPTQAGWVYLCVLIDLYSRKVVGWSLAPHMRAELCLDALRRALCTREPARGLIHHTDRGVQYTSIAYQETLRRAGATPSMSRKGDCWDNAVAESFFGTLEQELVGQQETPWKDEGEARRAVADYIHSFYNGTRRHSKLGYRSPVEFETLSQATAA